MQSNNKWYEVLNAEEVDSPSLFVYPSRVLSNIKKLKTSIELSKLRPHVKTNKIPEVCQMMISEGITKFKAATIAEAEMLATIQTTDVLLAYPLTVQKIRRLIKLVEFYPGTKFSCLVDSLEGANCLSAEFKAVGLKASAYIDLNVGMNRTGIKPSSGLEFYKLISSLSNLEIEGLHAYDGHIRDKDFLVRKQNCVEAFKDVVQLRLSIEKLTGRTLNLVAGGSPTSYIHADMNDRECSPGTFVFWDKGYADQLPEQPFEFAALVFCRIVSIPDNEKICVDLGYKSVASESPLPRVYFLNAPEAEALAQSEEHLVLKVRNSNSFRIGQSLYGVPWHICPTVALYDFAYVVEDKMIRTRWNVIARRRQINI